MRSEYLLLQRAWSYSAKTITWNFYSVLEISHWQAWDWSEVKLALTFDLWLSKSYQLILRSKWMVAQSSKVFPGHPEILWSQWSTGTDGWIPSAIIKKSWVASVFFFSLSPQPVPPLTSACDDLNNKGNLSFLIYDPASSLGCQVSVYVNTHRNLPELKKDSQLKAASQKKNLHAK